MEGLQRITAPARMSPQHVWRAYRIKGYYPGGRGYRLWVTALPFAFDVRHDRVELARHPLAGPCKIGCGDTIQ